MKRSASGIARTRRSPGRSSSPTQSSSIPWPLVIVATNRRPSAEFGAHALVRMAFVGDRRHAARRIHHAQAAPFGGSAARRVDEHAVPRHVEECRLEAVLGLQAVRERDRRAGELLRRRIESHREQRVASRKDDVPGRRVDRDSLHRRTRTSPSRSSCRARRSGSTNPSPRRQSRTAGCASSPGRATVERRDRAALTREIHLDRCGRPASLAAGSRTRPVPSSSATQPPSFKAPIVVQRGFHGASVNDGVRPSTGIRTRLRCAEPSVAGSAAMRLLPSGENANPRAPSVPLTSVIAPESRRRT